MVVYVRNEKGEEVARHVINVGALSKTEERTVTPVGGCDAAAGDRAGSEAGGGPAAAAPPVLASCRGRSVWRRPAPDHAAAATRSAVAAGEDHPGAAAGLAIRTRAGGASAEARRHSGRRALRQKHSKKSSRTRLITWPSRRLTTVA